jgi:uncharacterized protein (TIGR02266 family)
MHPEIENLGLPELVERLDDIEGRRTPVGWSPDDAVLRSAIERRILELVHKGSPEPERRKDLRVPCDLDVRLRSKKSMVRAHTRDLSTGGVFVETPPDEWAIGTVVELQVRGSGTDEYGLKVRGMVSWVTQKDDAHPGVGVSFSHDDSERHERRLRRFVVELLRHRVDL